MVNDSILYADIMTFWHITFPDFLIVSNVSGMVNVMSLVLTAAAWLLVFSSLGSFKIAQ